MEWFYTLDAHYVFQVGINHISLSQLGCLSNTGKCGKCQTNVESIFRTNVETIWAWAARMLCGPLQIGAQGQSPSSLFSLTTQLWMAGYWNWIFFFSIWNKDQLETRGTGKKWGLILDSMQFKHQFAGFRYQTGAAIFKMSWVIFNITRLQLEAILIASSFVFLFVFCDRNQIPRAMPSGQVNTKSTCLNPWNCLLANRKDCKRWCPSWMVYKICNVQ